MTDSLLVHIALTIYEIIWVLFRPIISRHPRLKEGLKQRLLIHPPKPADLWLHAASVGEAFLALEIIKQFDYPQPLNLLISTNTSQGKEVLDKELSSLQSTTAKSLTIATTFFPFDQPSLMRKALSIINPRLLILIEGELWPGLLAGCHQKRVPVILVNGRINQKSLERYLLWPAFWKYLRPKLVLAISETDSKRFARLFGRERVVIVENIKFDRVAVTIATPANYNPLDSFLKLSDKFIVLGSVRQEEELLLTQVISSLFHHDQDLIIGLFPRHMHRLSFWNQALASSGISFLLRSEITPGMDVKRGTVILWDRIGELNFAYAISKAVFVGGSLAPVGGQNFLEPLAHGVRPVIGPYWTNFAWIGREIVNMGLVEEVNDHLQLTETLLARISTTSQRPQVTQDFQNYLKQRRGGTAKICRTIIEILQNQTAGKITP
ncbi:MAG: 3-deoxy-D-manno-octulosonic acid transferase [Proteobacteria bacterium]|nr:3-deoxy-D-manno-octulosonic acid transferase [Pseudomonadota bacterium]MBU1686516.1 3-deoxy-D-manno-octulosonic acid transferase [Pseudomonadota bacterium]